MTKEVATIKKGGGFLVEETAAEDLFTPEDFSEEQTMIRDMTEQFVEDEVLPQVEKIEHPWARAVVPTPDGKLWISSYRDIRIWDAATGRLVRTIVPDELPAKVTLMRLRVSGDGKTVWAQLGQTLMDEPDCIDLTDSAGTAVGTDSTW